jgi:hypothetical protein
MRFLNLFSLILFVGFLSAQRTFGQDQVVEVSVKVGGESIQYKDSLPVDTLTVYKNFLVKLFIGDSLVSIDTTNATGKISPIKLQMNQVYILKFEKPGYASKLSEINTYYPIEKLDDLPPIIYQALQITLFELDSGCDFSFLETEPMAKFHFAEGSGYLEFDQNYTKQMLIRIEKLRRGMVD